MTEKPIIFSAPMVRAVIAGEKTQTRRVITPQPPTMIYNDGTNRWYPSGVWGGKDWHAKYEAGDLLWVRETFGSSLLGDYTFLQYKATVDTDDPCAYPIDFAQYEKIESKSWRPSIFMPRWASRITLRVTSVRAQRLQDISSGDAMDEGVGEVPAAWEGLGDTFGMGPLAFVAAFKNLWDDINAKRGYSWDSNPWVWAYKFEVVPQ